MKTTSPLFRIPDPRSGIPKVIAPATIPGQTGKGSLGMAMVCMWLVATGSEAAITINLPIRRLSSTNNKGASQVMELVDFGNINVSTRVDWEEYWLSLIHI